jgi:hypothetical protein
MDFQNLLKRAFRITIRYRALWIFGFFLALCSGSGGGQNFNFGGQGDFGGRDFGGSPNIPDFDPGLILALGLGVFCLVIILILVGVVVRAVTRASLIGMVDQIETTGGVTVRQGWQLGWSRSALTIFVIDLLIGIPTAIVFLLLLIVVVSPMSLALLDEPIFIVMGVIGTAGLFLFWLLLVFMVSLVISPLSELAWRYAVLQKLGGIDSLKASYMMLRARLKDVALTVLVLIGVAIAWGILNFLLAIVIVIIGALMGAIPGLIVYFITQEPWMAVLGGLPLFLVVVIHPLTFVTGLYMTFHSAFWTLVYRRLNGSEAELGADVVVLEPSPIVDEPIDEDSATASVSMDLDETESEADEEDEINDPPDPPASNV